MNYVGMAGIEVFDIEGRQVKIDEASISACPPDVNILPGYGGDPRTVDKLVDGSYFTNDDLHVWLTPFTAGEDHTITIDFGVKTQIAMIRLWYSLCFYLVGTITSREFTLIEEHV